MANWITLARYPLLLACLAILYLGSPPARLAGAVLLFLGLLLDTVDGVVARARSETSLIGSVLDIAADRTYELSLWVSFAYLGLVPAVIPLVVLAGLFIWLKLTEEADEEALELEQEMEMGTEAEPA